MIEKIKKHIQERENTMKKALLFAVSMVLVAAIAVAGTIAYFVSETETAVNVMVVGDIEIVQYEQERVNDKAEQNELQDYTQGKPLWPAVYEGTSIPWAPADEWVSANDQAWKVVADNDAVIDKFVTVENTGDDKAYVRTIFAIEVGTDSKIEDYVHLVTNSTNIVNGATWEWEFFDNAVVISDTTYVLAIATYSEALPAGETTIPSLKQIYLDKRATQEDCDSIGDTYEILALSQAVQTVGFNDPETALNEAFGVIDERSHPWLNGMEIPDVIATENQLRDVAVNGGKALIVKDIDLGNECVVIEKDLAIDLNGKTVSAECPHIPGVTLTTVEISVMVVSGAEVSIEDGTVINDDPEAGYAIAVTNYGTLTVKSGNYYSGHDVFYVKEGTLKIEGGFFGCSKDTDPYTKSDYSPHTRDYAECHSSSVINCQDDNYVDDKVKVIVTGGTFVNYDPSNVHEGRLHNQNLVADGYKVVAEAQSNGDVWYTVVAE